MNPPRLFICLPFLTAIVQAGTSTNYTLEPEAMNSGGLSSASAHYNLNSSLMPGGAGRSDDYTVRNGFAGQLSLATNIAITASPMTVNEGGTRQLAADLFFDDGNRSPLPASSAAWSVVSGPLGGISGTGLVTAAAVVFQDTPAVARSTYQTLTATAQLTVLNTLPDNYGSYAGDGLPDTWQVEYFGEKSSDAGPLVDADQDGYNNFFEYHARLNPTDPLSVFSFSISSAPGGGHQLTFSPRFPGSSYMLEGSNDLRTWAPVNGLNNDNGTVRGVMDATANTGRRFYSIMVRRQ